MDKMLSTPVSDAEVAPKMDRRSVRGVPVEVIVRAERRRVWTPEQKRDIVAESLGPDLTPTEVARKYGIGSGLLYTWRQQILTGPMGVLTRSAPNFAQVEMASGPLRLEASPPSPDEPMSPPAAPAMPRPDGLIEIVLPDGVSLRVDARVDVKALRRVLGVLREQ
jgi:transposase